MITNYRDLLQPVDLFALLSKLSEENQLATYVVGGFVRDILSNKNCKDIDIVCIGDGMILAEAFASHIPQAHVTTFKNFGTAMVMWENFQVEFVNARKESYAKSSRNPIVVPGSLEDDIMRRDFTVNTLAISLNKNSFGELIDMCGGMEDLKKKCIRTPLEPNRTLSDDPLRILRGIRFAVQLGYSIAPLTLQSMKEQAKRIHIVSKERICTEFNKILLSPAPVLGLRLLDNIGLLQLILPELEQLKGIEKINGMSHKDNFIHTLQVVENLVNTLEKDHPQRLWLIWAAILHDIAKPMTKQFDEKIGFSFHGHEKLGAKMVPGIFKRFGLPMRNEMRYVQKLVRLHLRHIPLMEEEVTDAAIRRFLYDVGDILQDLILLCRADITSGNTKKVMRYLENFDKLAQRMQAVEEKDSIRNFKPIITGDIIMKTFNLKPCHQIGIIKNEVKEAILEGKIPNEHQPAYDYMVTFAKNLGLSPTQT